MGVLPPRMDLQAATSSIALIPGLLLLWLTTNLPLRFRGRYASLRVDAGCRGWFYAIAKGLFRETVQRRV
jgi:hypothetical protein